MVRELVMVSAPALPLLERVVATTFVIDHQVNIIIVEVVEVDALLIARVNRGGRGGARISRERRIGLRGTAEASPFLLFQLLGSCQGSTSRR